jgi:hypothetical protein
VTDSRAEEVGSRRFFRNERVMASEILATTGLRTGAAAAGLHVLVIEDTTEINYQAKAGRKRGLGRVGNGVDCGLFVHSALAVEAGSGLLLGLAGGVIWNRAAAKAADYQDLVIEAKESWRWIDAFDQAHAQLGAAARVTLVTDREGDIYEVLARVSARADLIVRVTQDRAVNDAEKRLFARLAGQAVAETILLRVPAREGRAERQAKLELRYCPVRVRRPRRGFDARDPDEVALSCIEVREVAVPADVKEPLLWRLYTTHAVTTPQEARTIIAYYRQRWTIEQLHRTMKSRGLDIEESLLADAHALENYAAAVVTASVRVMQLVQARGAAGEGISAERVFDADEIQVLEAAVPKFEGRTEKQKNPHPHHSLAWAAWVIARLGGWKGYASERPPGPETFTRGLQRFTA